MYLGFEGDASALFRTSRPRRAEQRSKGDAPVRSVYQVRRNFLKLCRTCIAEYALLDTLVLPKKT